MYIATEEVPTKPFLSYAMVQGQEQRTLQVKGHTSLKAAERASHKIMRELRTVIENERTRTEPVLMSWGYMEIDENDRKRGIVL